MEQKFHARIAEKERFFEEYFFVAFLGKGFPKAFEVC
jgi:hypothetical protein